MPSWWREFFESPDSFRLAFFPNEQTTREQVSSLRRLLADWQPQRVLDLCCGHGRHWLPLTQAGHRVVGLDASWLMLGKARTAALLAGLPRRLVGADAQWLPFGDGSFDAVLCLFNSFGYLASDEANLAVLAEVARSLRPGGRFLLDTRNRDLQLSRLPFSEIVSLDDGGGVWLECDHDPVGRRLNSTFRSAGTGEVLYRASIRVYALDELRRMLGDAGLPVESVHGGYDWRPFRSDCRELLIRAVRR